MGVSFNLYHYEAVMKRKHYPYSHYALYFLVLVSGIDAYYLGSRSPLAMAALILTLAVYVHLRNRAEAR